MNREYFSRFKFWGQNRPPNFASAIVLSMILHSIILLLLFIPPDFSRSQAGSARVMDMDSFAEALIELQLGARKDGGHIPLPELSDKEVLDAIERHKLPTLNLEKDERAELYKKLIRAYLLLKEEKKRENPDADVTLSDVLAYIETLGKLELSSGDNVYPFKPSLEKQSLGLRGLTKEKRDRIKRLRQFEDMEKRSAEKSRGEVRVQTDTGIKYVPVEYYFRRSPYEEMLALGAELFTIVQGFPPLDEGIPLESSADKKKNIHEYSPSDGNMVVVLVEEHIDSDRPGFMRKKQLRPPLTLEMSEGRRSELLNSLMALSEEDQLDYFTQNFLEKYDSTEGDLAVLTREFIRKNLSNVVIVIDPISGAFDFMEELYYNKPTDRHFYETWAQSPPSKTTTEYLLYLAAHYDFEKRGLAYLMNAYPEAKKILSQRYYRANVFNKKLKSYIIKEIHDELVFALKKREYASFDEVFAKYIFEQTQIYDSLIESGGEAKNRGLYMKGCLYWDEGDYADAIETWKKIDRDFSSKVLREIRVILRNFPETNKTISLIDDIFEWQSSQSGKNLLERLLKYHRWQKRGETLPLT